MDPCDAVRLWCIGRRLTDDDPELAEAFRRWRAPAPGRDDPLAHGTPAAPWVLVVFATAFVVWTAGPALGVAVAVLAVAGLYGDAPSRPLRRPGRAAAPGRGGGGAQRRPHPGDDGMPSDFRWCGPWF